MYRKSLGLLLMIFTPAFGQTEGAKPELPPDQKTYNDAKALKDNAAKVAALRKFTTSFPKSATVTLAEFAIFTTLIKMDRANRKAIVKQAHRLMRTAKDDRSTWAHTIAGRLNSDCTFYREAERYSNKSVALLSENSFKRETIELYTTAKVPVPSDSDIHREFLEQRTYLQFTLADIYRNEGRLKKAEALLMGIVETDPTAYYGWLTYAEVVEKSGRQQQANELYIKAYMTGSATARAKVEATYKANHNGSISGLDEMMDESYKRIFPNPLHPAAYVPSAKRAGRVVLVELFTGAGCGPCVAADLTTDTAALHFDRKDVAIVAYHEHVPQPDPLTMAAGLARSKFYGVKGTPTFAIDGELLDGAGGSRFLAESAWKRVNTVMERELDTPPEAKLTIQAWRRENIVQASASLGQSPSTTPDSKLFLVLVEDAVRYSGENGIRFHGMVARAVFEGPQTAFNLDAITAANLKELDAFEKHSDRFGVTKFRDKPVTMNASHLGVVAFVQDMKTKKVLQASYQSVQSDWAPGEKL